MPRLSCSTCLRPETVCFCSHVVQQQNHWPVYIIQDIQESSHALGTARIAALSLSDCRLIRVNPDSLDGDSIIVLQKLQALLPVLIYPGAQAQDVTVLAANIKRPLLFIDASWRRSRKLLHTLPWLGELPRYALQASKPSRYRIRQQPGADAMSTLEAIVYTLQTLEPSARLDSLLATMDWVIDQQIRHMGADVYQCNYQDQESAKTAL